MAIRIFAFRNGKPGCGCLRQYSSTQRRTKKEEIIISNQPIIFNITYTPWKIKSNASEKDITKFERERPYYEMRDNGNSIYKYMTSDRKLNGENSKTETRSLIDYFQKSTGVFNGDGVITQTQLADIQKRARAEKNIWHGFVSLNKGMSHKIDSPKKCIWFVKRTFGEFFDDMGLEPKNIDLMCALHRDTPHHLHIHFWFAEKEPKCKYRKKQKEYLHKGKISKEVIDRMHVRLNLYVARERMPLHISRDESLKQLKKLVTTRDIITKDEVKEVMLKLAKTIPRGSSFHYGSKDMMPYREQIDKVVRTVLLYDKTARKADLRFHTELEGLRQKINGIIDGNGEHKNHYKINPKNITLIEDIQNDYKRRQGNLVLQAAKNIKSEMFVTRIKHKVNDNALKRRLAISRRKVGKLLDGFIASFGSDSELLERDFTNRLQEVEEEMQAEKEAQERAVEQAALVNSKWNWGK